MKRPMTEVEKNFITCAILMLIVGISLCILGKMTGGIVCIAISVVFVGIAISMIVKGDDNDKQ